MRIFLDCRSVFPGRGGIGRYAEALAYHLPAGDPDNHYTICTPAHGRSLLQNMSRGDRLEVEAGMIAPVWEQVQLPQLLKKHAIDLYHNPCFSIPAIKTTGVRIATVHDAVFRTHPEWVDPGLAKYLDTWTEHTLAQAHAVITVSEYSRQEIAAAYHISPERLHVVGNGVDDRFTPKAAPREAKALIKKWKLPEKFLLYVGAVEKKKNIDRLLDSVALLAQRKCWQRCKLVIAGGKGGQDYDLKAAIESRDLGKQVLALGHVPDEDVAPLMRAAEVVVYPSFYEGFGMPPLEAMACGTPVVVSDATSLPEVTGDAALIFPATDTEALANALERLAEDQALRQTYIEKGLRRAGEFTWAKTAERTLAVYRKALGGAE